LCSNYKLAFIAKKSQVTQVKKNKRFCFNALFFAAPDAILQIVQCSSCDWCEQHFITKRNENINQQ